MKKKKGPLILTGVLVILLIVYFGLSSWNKKQDKKVKIIHFFVSLIEEFSKFL